MPASAFAHLLWQFYRQLSWTYHWFLCFSPLCRSNCISTDLWFCLDALLVSAFCIQIITWPLYLIFLDSCAARHSWECTSPKFDALFPLFVSTVLLCRACTCCLLLLVKSIEGATNYYQLLVSFLPLLILVSILFHSFIRQMDFRSRRMKKRMRVLRRTVSAVMAAGCCLFCPLILETFLELWLASILATRPASCRSCYLLQLIPSAPLSLSDARLGCRQKSIPVDSHSNLFDLDLNSTHWKPVATFPSPSLSKP